MDNLTVFENKAAGEPDPKEQIAKRIRQKLLYKMTKNQNAKPVAKRENTGNKTQKTADRPKKRSFIWRRLCKMFS